MPFAANLKYIMQKSGLSNYKLAKELGCSQSSIKNWLDDNNIPHTKTRIKIAEHFGLTLAELDGDELPTLPPAAAPEKDIKKQHSANGEALVSELPEDIQNLIAICKNNPALTSALLAVAQQIETRPSAQE